MLSLKQICLDKVINCGITMTLLPDDLLDEIAQKIYESKKQKMVLEIKKTVEPFCARETFDPWIQNESGFYKMNEDLRFFFRQVNFDWFRCEKIGKDETTCFDMEGNIKWVNKKDMQMVLYTNE